MKCKFRSSAQDHGVLVVLMCLLSKERRSILPLSFSPFATCLHGGRAETSGLNIDLPRTGPGKQAKVIHQGRGSFSVSSNKCAKLLLLSLIRHNYQFSTAVREPALTREYWRNWVCGFPNVWMICSLTSGVKDANSMFLVCVSGSCRGDILWRSDALHVSPSLSSEVILLEYVCGPHLFPMHWNCTGEKLQF